MTGGLEETQYVELIGVVVKVVCIDSFYRGLGVPERSLPVPVQGEPSKLRPAGLRPGKAWVPMLSQGKAKQPEKDLFQEGPLPHVGTALSLVPDEVRDVKALLDVQYFSADRLMDLQARRALTRPQMELLASRVSALNQCFY